jgi:hypothetical protein
MLRLNGCVNQEYAVAQDLTSLSLIEVLIAATGLPPQHRPAFPPERQTAPIATHPPMTPRRSGPLGPHLTFNAQGV